MSPKRVVASSPGRLGSASLLKSIRPSTISTRSPSPSKRLLRIGIFLNLNLIDVNNFELDILLTRDGKPIQFDIFNVIALKRFA